MLAVREAMHYASCADASNLLICSFNAAASAYEVKPVFDLFAASRNVLKLALLTWGFGPSHADG
jgi:hypothetical protein